MALSDSLGTKTEQHLLDDNDFITGLVNKLKAGTGDNGVYTKTQADAERTTALANKVNVAGDNTTEAGVTAMLGKLTDKVVKTSELKTKAAEKEVVDAITASSDFTGKVYTKTAADAAFVKATELKTKAAEKDVVDAITASSDFTGKVYTKTAADAAFVKATELKTKAAEKDVVDAITASSDFTGKVYTKAAADTAFAKIDASNLTVPANKKAFAEAILPAQDGKKSILVNKLGDALDRLQDNADDKVYGTAGSLKIAKDFLADKYPFAKIDGTNISTQADKGKALADAILAVQDGKKSVLVEKLGEALDRVANTDTMYGTSADQTAKAFLIAKGLKPTSTEVANELLNATNLPKLAGELVGKVEKSSGFRADLAKSAELQTGVKDQLMIDQAFLTTAKTSANATDSGFQGAVREVMLQPFFDTSTDPNAPISVDW